MDKKTSPNYEDIYKLFYNRILYDTDFFNYGSVIPTEIQAIIVERSKNLLITSINKLYEIGTPDVDFYDRDDDLEIFNFGLYQNELDLFSHIMFVKYLELDVIHYKHQQTVFSNKDLKLIDDKGDRKSFMDLFNNREEKLEKSIKSYLARDRETNKYKTTNYSNFYS